MSDIIHQDGVSRSYRILDAGEKVVGNATVALQASTYPCGLVWVGAPTPDHAKGAENTGRILIGDASAQVQTLDTTDSGGRYIPISDAATLFLTGFNAGDAVEYIIWG